MNSLKIIRPAELAKTLSVSKQTLWRMENRGELPKRIKISERAVGWLATDIQEFLESKKEPSNNLELA